MKLISVNVSLEKTVSYNNKSFHTGIFKNPVNGRVLLRKENLEGDKQADLSNHGGLDKAVYAYPFEHYEYWRDILGIDRLPYGTFGENFTVSGLLEQDVYIGDIINVGETGLQVTQGRVPCSKLAIRVDRPNLPKLFVESLRCGFYLRVLETGMVGAGDKINLRKYDGRRISIKDAFEVLLVTKNDHRIIHDILELSELGEDWRFAYTRLRNSRRFSHSITEKIKRLLNRL